MRVPPLLPRLLKWTAVGGMGMFIKLAAAAAAREVLGLHYLAATLVAVETTLLHNFCWHQWWTWRDRSFGIAGKALLARALRFHATTGLLALSVNLLLVRLMVERAGVHYLAANLICIPLAGMLNFLASEFLVFIAAPVFRARQTVR